VRERSPAGTHVHGPAQPGPAAVREPAGQEVARRRLLLRERERAHLAPIDLEILGGQSLEADRHVAGRPLLIQRPPHAPHHLPKIAPTPGVGLLRVRAGQFQHPHRRQFLPDPSLDPRPIRVNHGPALPFGRRSIQRLAQDPRDGGRAMPHLACNLSDTLAMFGHQMNGAAFHLP